MKSKHLSFAGFVLLAITLTIPQFGLSQTEGRGRPEFAYAVDQASNLVWGFNIQGNGALTPLAVPSFPTGNAPNGVAVDPRGRFAYVVNILDNSVSGYSLAHDGT